VTWHNILHVKWTNNTNGLPADLTNLASQAASVYSAAFGPSLSNQHQLNSVTAQSLGGDGGLAIHTGVVDYTATGNPLSPSIAVGITWKANFSWRGGRPRTYLCGMPTTALTIAGSPQLTSGYCQTLANAAIAFLGQMNAITGTTSPPILGFPSYYTECQLRPTPLFFAFNTALVHARIDSQRRRTGKESTLPSFV
jgi:hypothetical protein